MGNSHPHGHEHKRKSQDSTASSGGGSNNSSKKDISRSASGTDIHERSTHLLPVEKLAKILVTKSQEEEGVNGVTKRTFVNYLFPRYPLLGEKLFEYFHKNSKSKVSYIGSSPFKQQCDRFLGILNDDTARDTLVRMFSSYDENQETHVMTSEQLKQLLMCDYHISMDHYSGGPQMCVAINKTLKAVIDSCFHGKESLSWQYVSHWLQANCPRLLLPLHRYAVHSLATSWRVLESDGPPMATGLELATPVLEEGNPFDKAKPQQHLLQMSSSWLLAGALPPLYSRPQKAHSPNSSGVGLSSQTFFNKFISAVPSHWILLYDSNEMGLGLNRFLHHVMGYKGPTLILIKIENDTKFCVACPNEWKESHQYWGGEESALFQIFPKFLLLDKGAKMLYLNTTVRGYPQGLRVGRDPRSPVISVNVGFEKLEYHKVPYELKCIEVWGCGDSTSREVQLEIKKWEIKEAERQRNVKLSAADWLDHPDRYLLELAGRPQYNDQQNPT
ncbi:uncharacterized protein LOC108736005 [Agrilus planipennis]|uniref:Uncharacterized protein LOC108736005 n=1 Tax=Agrilus planipennis TaxID=224129 RepID=A0A7F5R8C9_AGRPL|nr:uncharacterized protein LOC108736005 [Agrilus planipennis]